MSPTGRDIQILTLRADAASWGTQAEAIRLQAGRLDEAAALARQQADELEATEDAPYVDEEPPSPEEPPAPDEAEPEEGTE